MDLNRSRRAVWSALETVFAKESMMLHHWIYRQN